MLKGDSLSIFLFLIGTAIAAMIGALTAPQGWRARFLGGLTLLFSVTAVMWYIAPTASPIIQAITPIARSLVQSGALVMIGTVSFVALMLGRRPSEAHPVIEKPSPDEPRFAAKKHKMSKWKPDITFYDAVLYVAQDSRWGHARHIAMDTLIDELRGALANGKITAWGKEHPEDAAEFQINDLAWGSAEINFETGYAFFEDYSVAAHSLRLAKGELESAYPPKASK